MKFPRPGRLFLLLVPLAAAQAQEAAPKLLRPIRQAFNPVKIIDGHTIRDANNDGWDDAWLLRFLFPTGGGKIVDFTKDPNGDYNKNGVSNYQEMLNGNDPWPLPEKVVLSPEQVKERRQKAEELAAWSAREAAAWQAVLRDTVRKSFPAGASTTDPDFIRTDNAAFKTRLQAELLRLQADAPRVEAELDAIARKYGIARGGTDDQGRGWTLTGESGGAPVVVTNQNARAASGTHACDLWPASLITDYPWMNIASTRSLSGSGVTVAMFEGGANAAVLTGHLEFGGRVTQVIGTSVILLCCKNWLHFQDAGRYSDGLSREVRAIPPGK